MAGIVFEASHASIKANGHVGAFNNNAARDVINIHNIQHISGQRVDIPTCEEAIRWLRKDSVDYRRIHDEMFLARTKDTGGWFFDCQEFKDWKDGKVKNLQCIGMPGAGKTSLASAVIEHLQAIPHAESYPVLYIYCKQQLRSIQSMRTILANLLSQIVTKRSVLSEEMVKLFQEYKSSGDAPRLDLSVQALKAEIPSFTRTYLIFDALDECLADDHFDVVKVLESLGVQLLITCRWEVPFRPNTQTCARIDVHAHDDDILAYIKQHLEEGRLSKMIARDSSLAGEIITKLRAKSNGMFLISRLHIELMKRQQTPQGIRDTLNKLPATLEATFELTMERIQDQPNPINVRNAIRMFSWLIYAVKNLSVIEILHALAVAPDMRRTFESNLPLEEDVLSACCGLVMVVGTEESKPEFRFTHFSVQEFLMQHSSRYLPEAEHEITESCLRYLITTASLVDEKVRCHLITTSSEGASEEHGEDYEDYRSRNLFNAFPLSRYAGCYWVQHAANIKESFNHALVTTLFQDSLAPYMYDQKYARDKGFVETVPRMNPGHYQLLRLVSYGLLSLVMEYFDGPYPDAETVTALGPDIAPAKNTHFEPMYRDAALNCADRGGDTPLCIAAICGHFHIAALLVKRGADVSPPSRTPLWWAAEGGHLDIVQLLLDNGAEVDRGDQRESEIPLCRAARQGHYDIAKLLLNRGADPNKSDDNGYTPIGRAAKEGHVEIVRLLLANGASPNPPADARVHTPLWLATYWGKLGMVKFLLENGADPNQPGKDGEPPLVCAARRRESEIVEELLDHGASTDLPESCGGPLWWAAYTGDLGMAQSLIDKGALVDQADDSGETPLCVALKENHADAARFLLENGANPNPPGDYCGEPLWWAVYNENLDMVELLPRYHANPNQPNSWGETPLHRAIRGKFVNIVALLLSKGAMPKNDDERREAEHLASVCNAWIERTSEHSHAEMQENEESHPHLIIDPPSETALTNPVAANPEIVPTDEIPTSEPKETLLQHDPPAAEGEVGAIDRKAGRQGSDDEHPSVKLEDGSSPSNPAQYEEKTHQNQGEEIDTKPEIERSSWWWRLKEKSRLTFLHVISIFVGMVGFVVFVLSRS